MALGRWGANLATLANALVGVGAIAYTLAGNKLWAMLLIVCGIGFDGLDGWLHRRSGLPEGRFGRIADSVADAITFGLAPAFLLIVHTEDVRLWQPWALAMLVAGVLLAALAFTRLTWFSLRAFRNPYFVGVPTPQTALGLAVVLLWFEVPAFGGTRPAIVLVLGILLAIAMVIPLRFPKIRRTARLRWPMTVTAVALVLALLPLQFHVASGSLFYDLALAATLVATAGVAMYYLIGPLTVSLPLKDSPVVPP